MAKNEGVKTSAHCVEWPGSISKGGLFASISICLIASGKKERKEQERKGLTQQVSLLHLVTVSHRVRKYLGEQSRTFSQDGSTKGFFMGT